jgi:hypothetical protein
VTSFEALGVTADNGGDFPVSTDGKIFDKGLDGSGRG